MPFNARMLVALAFALGSTIASPVTERDVALIDPTCDIFTQGLSFYADGPAINEGVKELKLRDPSTCVLQPHSISRVTCSWNSGIYLVNNNDRVASMPCYDAAFIAEHINGPCAHTAGAAAAGQNKVNGQEADATSGLLVVVSGTSGSGSSVIQNGAVAIGGEDYC